jgi:hypothetical protein
MLKSVSGILSLFVLVVFTSDLGGATLGYWRFETGPAGANVAHTGAAGVFHGTTEDVSGNTNHLSVWSQGGASGYAYRSDVPFKSMPQNGETNKFSVKNTGGFPALFTSPTGQLKTITPSQFTIEASYKPENSGGYRTVVGRDAQNVATGNGSISALYLQVRPDDSVRVQFVDVSGYTHEAYSYPGLVYGFNFASNPEGTNTQWYHLAAVSDGTTLKLYVNNILVASTNIAASGSPDRSLAIGTTSGGDWVAGAWSVGRGLYNGGHTDRAFGFIDEVRISDTALTPNEFLAAPRAQILNAEVVNGSLVFTATNGHPRATCRIMQSTNPTAPPAEWTQIATRTFNTNGAFTFTHAPQTGNDVYFYSLNADVFVPPAGPLTYQLAGNWQSWPADIRSRIVYAMNGAIALYNRFGTFQKSLSVYYDPGVPTAQANYNGRIDFGGQIGYRTALHEISHTLGVGTIQAWDDRIQGGLWTGTNAIQLVRQFDGPSANINSDGTHFWPYGLNFDNEGGTENNRRHVLLVQALRKDMGL